MPQANQQDSSANVVSFGSEAQQTIAAVRQLRHLIVDAWQERSVILTSEEQSALRNEIRETYSLLTDLTAGA